MTRNGRFSIELCPSFRERTSKSANWAGARFTTFQTPLTRRFSHVLNAHEMSEDRFVVDLSETSRATAAFDWREKPVRVGLVSCERNMRILWPFFRDALDDYDASRVDACRGVLR